MEERQDEDMSHGGEVGVDARKQKYISAVVLRVALVNAASALGKS
jgi:hypothetical protein